MLKISNQAMRQQLEDADTRAELDRCSLQTDKNYIDIILDTSQQEYEKHRDEAKQDKKSVSTLEPQVEAPE